jgi:hypothetical protein
MREGNGGFCLTCKFNGEIGVVVFCECVSSASVGNLNRAQPRLVAELSCHANMSGRVFELLTSSLPYNFRIEESVDFAGTRISPSIASSASASASSLSIIQAREPT